MLNWCATFYLHFDSPYSNELFIGGYMKFILKLILTVIVTLVVGLGVIIFYPNLFLKGLIEDIATQTTKTEVTLGKLDYSLFNGTSTIEQFKIDNPQGFDKTPYLFRVGEIKINVDADTVFENVTVIDLVKIVAPSISYERNKTSNNIETLQANIEQSIEKNREVAGIESSNNAQETRVHSEKKFIIKKFILQDAKVRAHVKVFGKDINQQINLPDLVLTNLGKKSGGATAREIAKQLFEKLSNAIRKIFVSNRLDNSFSLNVNYLKEKATEKLNQLKNSRNNGKLLEDVDEAIKDNVDKAKELLKNFRL